MNDEKRFSFFIVNNCLNYLHENMLDKHLEPDDDVLEKEISDEYFWEKEDEINELEMQIAEHNYECLIYREPELMIKRWI